MIDVTVRSQPDGDLKNEVRKKILRYHQLYADHPSPIVFLSLM